MNILRREKLVGSEGAKKTAFILVCSGDLSADAYFGMWQALKS